MPCGSSLPRAGGLVDTSGLTWVREVRRPGTVTCGAGVSADAERHRAASRVDPSGCERRIRGTERGGYLAAGGFGPGSRAHGGFWENVYCVALLTSGCRPSRRDSPLFPWLFGAMGQLGIVVELTLDLVAVETDKLSNT